MVAFHSIAPALLRRYNLYWDIGDCGPRPPMNISVKGEYALQAIFDLASQRPGEPIRSRAPMRANLACSNSVSMSAPRKENRKTRLVWRLSPRTRGRWDGFAWQGKKDRQPGDLAGW